MNWILYIVLTTQTPGMAITQQLAAFNTQEECETMRDSVTKDMVASYPGAKDFLLVCQFRPKKVVA